MNNLALRFVKYAFADLYLPACRNQWIQYRFLSYNLEFDLGMHWIYNYTLCSVGKLEGDT